MRSRNFFPLAITADNYSSQQSGRGVAGEQLGIAAVHPQHLQRFVAGLVADLHQVDAALYRRRDQARPQAVPAKGCRVEAKLGGGSLDTLATWRAASRCSPTRWVVWLCAQQEIIKPLIVGQSMERAVPTPRSDRAFATPRRLVIPLACIWWIIGSTSAANASAASDELHSRSHRRRPSERAANMLLDERERSARQLAVLMRGNIPDLCGDRL